MDEVRVLVALQLRSYREAIAAALEVLRPDVGVFTAEPEVLEAEMERLAPHLLICSCITPAAEAAVLCWIELYPGHQSLSRASIGGETSMVVRMELEDILSVVDQTQDLVEAC